MNKVTLIGNLTRDPETRSTQSGGNMVRFGVAVNRRRKQEGQPEADFFNVTCMGRVADLAMQYLKKGRKVCITGSLQCNQYTGQDGSKRYSLDVFADDMEFLPNAPREGQEGGGAYGTGQAPQGNAPAGGGYYGQQSAPPPPPKQPASPSYGGYAEIDEDDLPF